MFYTYAHTKPDGTIFYIGKGKAKRAWSKTGRNEHWERIIAKYKNYGVEILANWSTEKEALDHEVLLISCFRDMGHILCNMTNGGEGFAGLKRTKNHNKKIGLSKLGKKRKPFSEEWIKKLSKATVGENNPRAISIKYNGIIFGCVKDLAKYLNKPKQTIYSRVQMNPKKWGYEVLV
jgi:hypothetical protein